MATTTSKDEKTIFWLSLLSLIYFALLVLNAKIFYIENIAVGILRELVTIPAIIGQFIVLYFAWRAFRRGGYVITSYSFISIIITTTLITFFIVSFLISGDQQ